MLRNFVIGLLVINAFSLPCILAAAASSENHFIQIIKQKNKQFNEGATNTDPINLEIHRNKKESTFPRSLEASQSDQLNTLENVNEVFNDQQRDPLNYKSTVRQRFKQSIPVLEPVRHLLNHVREGNFNHTVHFNGTKSRHHLINASNSDSSTMEHNNNNNNSTTTESAAIETEEEREKATESVNFQILDFLGSLGSEIFSNFRNFFSTTIANASAASSSSSSSG